jgi:hypothetical protein
MTDAQQTEFERGYEQGYEAARRDLIALVSGEGQKALIGVIVGLLRATPRVTRA